MSDDLLATDPNWAAVARFLEGRVGRGQRVTAPPAFARVTGPLAAPDVNAAPDWAVVHKGQLDDYPFAALRRIATETTPVFANDVFVVFARRPTFGLRNQRHSVHVAALLERLGGLTGGGAALPASPSSPPPVVPDTAPAPPPVVVPRAAEPAPARPSLPPEALALLRTAPTPADAASDGLRDRIAALLAGRPAARIAEIGIAGLSRSLGGAGPQEGATDAVLLRVTGAADLGAGLGTARDLLAPNGRLLVIAENADSLGRRLARAAGRHAPGDLGLAELLGTLRAAGFRPDRAEGFSLDPWRAAGDLPPPDQAPGTPGGDILDAAGADAGPDHAALLLVLADRA